MDFFFNILYQSTQEFHRHKHLLAATTTVNQATQILILMVFCMVPISSGMVSSVMMKATAAQALHGLRGLVSNYRATHQKT